MRGELAARAGTRRDEAAVRCGIVLRRSRRQHLSQNGARGVSDDVAPALAAAANAAGETRTQGAADSPGAGGGRWDVADRAAGDAAAGGSTGCHGSFVK